MSLLLLLLLISCTRLPSNNDVPVVAAEQTPTARPLAILQPGEVPLWFQLTEGGPVLLGSIEDAVFSAALVPWPLALHVRFFHERDGEIIMAVNRDGFMKLSPVSGETDGIAMYRFGGGSFWNQYTIGGFVFYEDQPVILLYLDDRFLDSNDPLPNPRTWTFNMESNNPFPVNIPVLESFPAEEGWDADTLRLGNDGFWYYRAAKRKDTQGEIQIFRTENLAQAGIVISVEDFFNSAPRKTEINDPSLPPLPDGFVYTGIARIGGSLFACWEEQSDFNIGAAGFMMLKE